MPLTAPALGVALLISRRCYDSPAMTILRWAHLDLEGLVLDGRVRSLRDQFVTQYVLAGLCDVTGFPCVDLLL